MGTPTDKNVIIGPTVAVYTIPNRLLTVDPMLASQVVAWDTDPWVQVGYTTPDGVEITYNQEWFDAMVEQHEAPLKTRLIAESFDIKISIAEADLFGMSALFPQATYTNGVEITPTADGLAFGGKPAAGQAVAGDDIETSLVAVGLEYIGPQPTPDVQAVMFWPKCRMESFETINMKKGETVNAVATFHTLVDSTRTAATGKIGIFREQVIDGS